MKNKYVNFITFAALICILFLQGLWLYNNYKLLEKEFTKSISSHFFYSIEKEAKLRLDDPERKIMLEKKKEKKIIEGYSLLNDAYTNNRILQDYLFKEDLPFPISLERVDSIFKEDIKTDFGSLYYSLSLSDSLKNQITILNHGQNSINNRFNYKETIQLRNIAPEYLTLTILSPYKIIFSKMILMLLASFVLAIIVIYGLILQIRMINRLNTIANIRQDFTHSMIHNMKNPIATIIMSIGALKSGKFDDKPQMKESHYSIIKQEGEHILKLANKILEIAQFEGEQSVLSKQHIDLQNLFEKLKTKFIINTQKKVNINIELNGVENIYADPYFISEAFDDLIDNAIKYSKEDCDVEINITSSHIGKDVQISFKDNGIGISENDQKVIFNKFERSMSVIKNQSKTTGFGLGLNYVYQVVKAHKGTVNVNSILGSFTEFIISLPNSKHNNHENNKTIIS